jgi:hypothetical protein
VTERKEWISKDFLKYLRTGYLRRSSIVIPTEGLVFKPCPAKIVKNALYFRHQCYEKYGRNSTE